MYEDLIKRLRDIASHDSRIESNYIGLTLFQAADAIEVFSKTADVRPVVRARWNTVKYPLYECSNCGAVYQEVGYGFKYCPNCGADMMEEDNGDIA